MPITPDDGPDRGRLAASISTAVVHAFTEHTGRGPTRARTYINENLVTVLLQDTLTKGERSLVSDELGELVLTMRKAFQRTMRHDLIAGIEQILGRTVIAFMSDNHLDPDVAVEVFVLAPAGAKANADGAPALDTTPSQATATAAAPPTR